MVRRAHVLLVGVVLLAAACSGGSSGGSGSAPDEEAGPETTTTTALAIGPDVAPVPSAGCDPQGTPPVDGRVEVPDAPGAPDGEPRWYLLAAPDDARPDEPLPVVLDLHGYSAGAEVQAATSRLGGLADRERLLAVAPQGSGPVPAWGLTPTTDGDDFAFLVGVLDELEARHCVDRARVFATGLSNGAMMTTVLACTLAGRIAAIGPVAGLTEVDPCDPSRPVPLLTVHGTEDGFLSFEGGIGDDALDLPAPDGSGRTIRDLVAAGAPGFDDPGVLEGPSIPELAATWARRNGCSREVTTRALAPDVEERTWNCPPDGDTVLVVIEGGGHTWPGSELMAAVEEIVGPTTFEVDATELLWEFFREHARPPADP